MPFSMIDAFALKAQSLLECGVPKGELISSMLTGNDSTLTVCQSDLKAIRC